MAEAADIQSAYAAEQERLKRERAQAHLRDGLVFDDSSPDSTARHIQDARRLGVTPVELSVSQQLQRAAQAERDLETLNRSPALKAWLSEPTKPERLAVARDDIPTLADLEQAWTAYTRRPDLQRAVAQGSSPMALLAENGRRALADARAVQRGWNAASASEARANLLARKAASIAGRQPDLWTADDERRLTDATARMEAESRGSGLPDGALKGIGVGHSLVSGGIALGTGLVEGLTEAPGLIARNTINLGNPYWQYGRNAPYAAMSGMPQAGAVEPRQNPVTQALGNQYLPEAQRSGLLPALVSSASVIPQVGMARGVTEFTASQEAGSAFEQYTQLKTTDGRPLDPQIAAEAAMIVGAINGGIELSSDIVIGGMMKLTPKALREKLLAEGGQEAIRRFALDAALKKYRRTIVGGAVTEGVIEEGAQGLVTQLNEEKAKAKDGGDFAPTDWAEVWSGIAEQMAYGALGGGVMGATFGAIPLAYDMRDIERAQQNAATIQRLSSAAAKSRLLKRDPEAFADAARAIAPEESVVLIDADAFAQIAQDKGMAPAELAQTLGVKTDDLDAAMNGNGMLQMPVADYLAKFASNDVGAALTSHITFDPDTPTLAQAEKEQAIAEKVAADIAKEAQAEVKQQVAADPAESPDAPYRDIYRATLDRLNAISSEPGGRTRADNEKNALLFTQGIATLAKRAGIDPREAFRRFAPTVETEAYPQARNPRIERGLETLDAKSWIALPHRDLALAAGPEGDVVHFTAKRATTVGGVTVKKGEVGVVHQDGRVEAMAPEAFAAAYQPQAAPAQAHAETMQAWRTAAGGPPTTASPITIEEIKHGFRATDSRSGRVTETYSSAGGITTRTKQEGAEWGRDALVLNEEGAWVSVNSIVLMDGTDSSRKPWRGSSRATKAALDVLRKLEDESLSRDMRDKLNDALLDIVFYGDRKLDEVEALVAETSQEPAGTETLEQAQKAGYGGNDTGEAEEWLRAKAKGLDMSTEARMARAREMGLNPPVSDERAANVVGVSADAQGDFLEGQTGGVKRAREVGVPSLGDLTRIWNSVGLGNPPSTLEGFQDVVRQSPELLSDFAESLAALKKGSSGVDIVAHRVVLARVLPVLQDFQVLDAIVEAIPVDVMNVFFGEQGAPKSLFGNEAMLFDLFAVNGDVNVTAAISAAAPAMRVMARMAAKKVGSPSYVAALSQDLFFAYGASHTNWQSQSPSVLEPKAYSIYSQGAFDPDYADSANILAQPAPETFNQETTAPALAQAEQLAAAVREAAACAAREGVEGALVGALAPIMAGNALAAAAAVPLGIVGVPALVEAGKGPPDEEQQRRRLEALRAHWREVLPQSPFPADIAPDMGNAVTLSEAALAAANEPAPQPMGAADTGAQPMNSKGLPLPEPASAPEPEQ